MFMCNIQRDISDIVILKGHKPIKLIIVVVNYESRIHIINEMHTKSNVTDSTDREKMSVISFIKVQI